MSTARHDDVKPRLRSGNIQSQVRSLSKHRADILARCPKEAPTFREPMQCKLTGALPTHGDWLYEIKFDGFRALAIKDGNRVRLVSRNKKDLSSKFPELVESVSKLPCRQAVLDGEIVALNEEGWPSFQILQNLGSSGERKLFYYAFDLLNLDGKDVTQLALEDRRWLLERIVEEKAIRLRLSHAVQGDSEVLLRNIQQHRLEGIVGKRAGSLYEVGQRSGSWIKYKNLQEQEFVIGGYTPPEGSRQAFGAILVGYYEAGELRFAAKVGTGFTWDMLRRLYRTFQPLRQPECPFVNLPEKGPGKWGQGLTAAKMKSCTWLKPQLVCQVGFTEWTDGGHLRHPSFKGLREDKVPREVLREISGS